MGNNNDLNTPCLSLDPVVSVITGGRLKSKLILGIFLIFLSSGCMSQKSKAVCDAYENRCSDLRAINGEPS